MDPHYEPKTKRQRSIVDIVYDMVVPAVGRSTKKYILYRAYISSTQVEYYFLALLAHDCLERLRPLQRRRLPHHSKGNEVLSSALRNTVPIGLMINIHRLDPMSEF